MPKIERSAKISIPRIRIGRDIHTLSPLEHDVIRVLWRYDGGIRVRHVHAKLRMKKIALTSVAVILDRLHKKRLVGREIAQGRGGSHYIYSPLLSQRDFELSVMDAVVERLLDRFGHTAVSYFNGRFSRKKKRAE
ncbi:MAG: BlaI/MecI/CopY family transcriptional regulator [Candidatus Aenigmarchaeota archaeon]|nr:BlaI/MecI/CopY family transcriptional regulator [Candidatus Aenigmarchaeota archaeon]